MNIPIISTLLLVFYLLVFLLLVFFAIAGVSLAPWVPLYPKDKKRIMELLALRDGDILYELGSGTGIVTIAASRVNGVRATGLELSPVLYWYSLLKKIALRAPHARFLLRNLYTVDLSDATVIYFYGLPKNNHKIVKKLLADCKPGTRIVSYTFSMDGLPLIERNKPIETVVPIYIYQIP